MRNGCRSIGLFVYVGVVALALVAVGCGDDSYNKIFNGETLDGWEGDLTYWRAENGTLIGEVTPDTILSRNSFIIWRGGGVVSDFDLVVDYRISDHGNSGINYRSEELTDVPYAMRGYQADIDGENKYTGQNYEERGRTFLAERGQINELREGSKCENVATSGNKDNLTSFIKPSDEWNEYHIIVRGNTLTHIINGQLMSVVIDDDPANRKTDGLIGVQVHTGPPMKVEFRDFRFKRL
jgi:hypothetical protein